MTTACNAWGEPIPPNPVTQIIVTRTAQVGGAAAIALAGLSAVIPTERLLPFLPFGGLGVSVGLSVYFTATFTARVALPGCPQIARLPDNASNAVALTFDDGPHPDTTPRLLDMLAQAQARATFFLVGERVTQFPKLVQRIAEEGHTIGIHGLRHRTMVLQNSNAIKKDLLETVTRIEEAIYASLPRPLLLRPPYGFKSWTVCQTAARLGFVVIAWSIDPRDYDPTDSLTIRTRIERNLRAGEIILLHERPDHPTALEVLPEILALCKQRGLIPVALSASIGVIGDLCH